MSILSDVIVIDPIEAKEVCSSDSFHTGTGRWQAIQTPGLSSGKLRDLLCILRNTPRDASVLREFPLLYQESEEGPWVINIPSELIEKVGSIDDQGAEEYLRLWMNSPEFVEEDWEMEACKELMDNLRHFFKLADLASKVIVLRICL